MMRSGHTISLRAAHHDLGVEKTSPRPQRFGTRRAGDKAMNSVIEENIVVNEVLRQQAEQGLTTLHRPIEQIGALVGRPTFIFSVLGPFTTWIGVNLWLKFSGRPVWDQPPFFWLQGVVGLLALLVTTTVLVAQARQA